MDPRRSALQRGGWRASAQATGRALRQTASGDWSGPLHQLRHLIVNRSADPDKDLNEQGGSI
jgi:hypothetical protein